MQPPEKKTEAVETAPPATEPAESETLSKRAEGILEAVEASTRSAGLTGAGMASSGSASGSGRGTRKAASSERPREEAEANPTTGSMQLMTGEDWAHASAILLQRQQEITAVCRQAEWVRDGLAEFAEQLAAAGDEARCLTEQLEGAIQDGRVATNEQNQLVGETVAECDRTHQALLVTLESSRRISDQLVSLNQAGRQITEMVTGNISDAHAASDRLVATVQSATAERVRTVNEESQQQTKLRHAMESVAEMIDTQKRQWELQQETTKTLTRHHEESRALLAELATARDDAARSVRNVTDASAEAARVLELFTELFVHVESKQQVFEDGQRVAKQFVDQASGIQETLDELQEQSQRLQKELGTALAAPKRVVADADAHAQQLSDVCRAVRKVFAGVSKMSLEAHERVTTFKELRDAVDERIEQLQTHTTTASETLRQWVAEAAHAQERLAATLERAPSIQATHPAGSLAALADGHGNTASGTGVTTASAVPATAPIESKVKTPQDADTISYPTTGTVEVGSADAATQSADAEGKSSAIAKMIDEARRRCGIGT